MSDMLTVAAAAERLGVSGSRVNVLIRQGRLPGSIKVKVPWPAHRRWLIPEQALNEFQPRQTRWFEYIDDIVMLLDEGFTRRQIAARLDWRLESLEKLAYRNRNRGCQVAARFLKANR